jgi:hypothetical protein
MKCIIKGGLAHANVVGLRKSFNIKDILIYLQNIF